MHVNLLVQSLFAQLDKVQDDQQERGLEQAVGHVLAHELGPQICIVSNLACGVSRMWDLLVQSLFALLDKVLDDQQERGLEQVVGHALVHELGPQM